MENNLIINLLNIIWIIKIIPIEAGLFIMVNIILIIIDKKIIKFIISENSLSKIIILEIIDNIIIFSDI